MINYCRAFRDNDAEALAAMRRFVAASARGARRERILSGNPRPCGILERLCYEDGKAFYIAGQYYPGEMATLRDLFDGRRR